jgi:KipI family sensor histidine kinase inhibitor
VTERRPVHPLGDSALVADAGSTHHAHALARALGDAGHDIEEIVVGLRTVTVVVDPDAADTDGIGDAMATLPATWPGPTERRDVEIPVDFDGPDLDEVAALARIRPGDVVDRLEAAVLEVAFVGFAPGFAYLVGLPPELAAIGRRATPRPAVPAGSVAVAGGFAGVYPSAMPGGWHVLGRSGLRLFDPRHPPYSVLTPGDTVRFVRGEVDDPGPGDRRELLRPEHTGTGRSAVVEEPGLLTLVQDTGRTGVAALGVPRAGAADPDGLQLANRLVGNDPGAAALECTVRGPALRFTTPAHVALVGDAPVHLDGRLVPPDVVLSVATGQTLAVGAVRGTLRAYLAVDGGLETPVLLGSRSSDVLCDLGPGRLQAGDELGIGPPSRPHGRLERGHHRPGPERVLRVIAGPDPLPDALERLAAETWSVGDASNRVGIRLHGPTLPVPARSVASRGVVTGVVQAPPDGAPIVLSCDHATVGGYPVVATVVRADLGQLGRCRPGDAVRFEVVDLEHAARLRAERARRLERRVMGWFPTRSD